MTQQSTHGGRGRPDTTDRAPLDVTVLVPVRDGMRWLRPTVASLHRLRGDALEILVVDDGSTDGTADELSAAAARDPRWRVVTLPPRGLVYALNAGLEMARGQYVARMDADDIIHPLRVEHQLRLARETGAGVVGCRVRCFPTQRISVGLQRYERWQNSLISHEQIARERYVESPVVHPSVLYEREAVLAVGGYRDRGWPEDYDLWLRLLSVGVRFTKAERTLTYWRDHRSRLTRTAACCSDAAVCACKIFHLMRGPLAEHRRFWVAGTGRDGKRIAAALQAAGAIQQGWIDINPRRIGKKIYGAWVKPLDEVRLADGDIVLAAVGSDGGRERIRSELQAMGWAETRDFWCVA